MTSCPAISIPCGFTADGRLPVGLQIVGPPRGEAQLLAVVFYDDKTVGTVPDRQCGSTRRRHNGATNQYEAIRNSHRPSRLAII